MTPHPNPRSHRHRVHVPRGMGRQIAALLAAVLVIVGTPLAARALGDDFLPEMTGDLESPTSARPEQIDSEPVVRSTASARDFDSTIDADPVTAEAFDVPDAAVDPVIALLSDTYAWDERGPRIMALQDALGVVAVDGRYGYSTQRAHTTALAFVGLPVELAPAPVLPPGPAPSEWAALRECESHGNYAITNPSGTYRGAYQFDRSTWNSVAGRHAAHLVGVDPAAAAPADQDFMALALYSERGARPWPHCGRHLS